MKKLLLLRYRCDVVEREYSSIDLSIAMHGADVATERERRTSRLAVNLSEKYSRSERRFGVCDQTIITSEVFN